MEIKGPGIGIECTGVTYLLSFGEQDEYVERANVLEALWIHHAGWIKTITYSLVGLEVTLHPAYNTYPVKGLIMDTVRRTLNETGN